jgi:hypothetical protein
MPVSVQTACCTIDELHFNMTKTSSCCVPVEDTDAIAVICELEVLQDVPKAKDQAA